MSFLMERQIVDIEYQDGSTEIARIISSTGDDYIVRILHYDRRCGLFKFSEETIAVPRESISGFYDTQSLEDTGLYMKYDDVYYEQIDESDPDVMYNSSDESESDSEVSLCEEDLE